MENPARLAAWAISTSLGPILCGIPGQSKRVICKPTFIFVLTSSYFPDLCEPHGCMCLDEHSIQDSQDGQTDQPPLRGPQEPREGINDIAQGWNTQSDRQNVIPADGQ